MARVLFDLPDRFCFETTLQVYISHVNQGGHLDNAQLLSLVSEARLRFFQAMGMTEANAGGAGIVVGDMLAQYKSEAFHGEQLIVRMRPMDFNRYGFDLVFQMTESTTGREVARGKTGIVFVSHETRRATPIPPLARERLDALLAHMGRQP
ncbi:MAG: thioesterase [Comamonas sp. SCN 65-56]|uniref:Thioesterase n=1 Tax=Comamonas flocculans TaxID=2597701 RepID=A0A5B8RTU1_9BURK|nr:MULTISPECIES: thioesterase family protein [Comamonas]ODS93116.1 MAG: thioesterase [Comamonas sp. SCN 65-56]QEA12910.1 thioesterase [Comamonas flocculans]